MAAFCVFRGALIRAPSKVKEASSLTSGTHNLVRETDPCKAPSILQGDGNLNREPGEIFSEKMDLNWPRKMNRIS